MLSEEHRRLDEDARGSVPPWQKWGPYVAERAWGTVREDYSAKGDYWNSFSRDQAASRAFRWGDDAIAGWCDRYQVLLFAPVFWNTKDPILKERLFGLGRDEGNHGEDVKECYYHLDGVPTHSYMKYLYRYPQTVFPYQQLLDENRKRTAADPEYELMDTGVFSDNCYFDISIEYAKASSEDLCIQIQIFNRSEHSAPLHVLPQIWFRNQWSWDDLKAAKPNIQAGHQDSSIMCLEADDSMSHSPPNLAFDYHLGKRYLYGPNGGKLLFTDNESRLEGNLAKNTFFKDAFHQSVIHNQNAVNPQHFGTKACMHYVFGNIPGKSSVTLYLRLSDQIMKDPLKDVAGVVLKRKQEADAFYETVHPKNATADEKRIQRQALAGILWNKQIYLYDVNRWLRGDNPNKPPPETRLNLRNVHWNHLNSMRILVVPDKWEAPYFSAWDLAFHCLSLALVDMKGAKEQLWWLLFDQFQHPNGQIPSSEEEFSSLNPPLQAWAALKLFEMEKSLNQTPDFSFLKRCFHKLIINFSWWINKVDSSGYNVFEGGFLGLDNITILERGHDFASGIKLQQSDGTGWMALFCLNLMRMALELSKDNPVYESMATKFFQHFVYIANAMKKRDEQDYEMWCEEDGFFYDVLCHPDGSFHRFPVRSIIGIIPLFAVDYWKEEELRKYPEFYRDFKWFLQNRKDLVKDCVIPLQSEGSPSYILALMNRERLMRILQYVWNPDEFRSEFGLRSLSKFHLKHPFRFDSNEILYEPGHSAQKVNGGNVNWRGPVWLSINFLLIEALKKFARGYGGDFQVQVGGEVPCSLSKMAAFFANRLLSLFNCTDTGARKYIDSKFSFQNDPNWKDCLLFYDFFNSETGEGLGACQQTGWTALVANLIHDFRN